MVPVFLEARRKIRTLDKFNPVWLLFGNEDDGVCPDWFLPERPRWYRMIRWWIRNPCHNLMFYVIGVADRDRVLLSDHGTDVHALGGGWLVCVTYVRVGGWPLPFISYLGKRVKCYIGWRPAGAFGGKFNVMR